MEYRLEEKYFFARCKFILAIARHHFNSGNDIEHHTSLQLFSPP